MKNENKVEIPTDCPNKKQYHMVKKLNISNTNAKGMVRFTQYTDLTHIDCSHNQITDLDLWTVDSTLTHLNCAHNQITWFDVQDCITHLTIYANPLTRLIFTPESAFNQNIDTMFDDPANPDSPQTLTHLFLGDEFNTKINKLPKTLRYFFPGHNYPHPIGNLLLGCPNLVFVNFGVKFNHQISKLLPVSLETLGFDTDSEFNQPLDLTELVNLTRLELGSWFDQELDKLPVNLKFLTFSRWSKYSRTLGKLPGGLILLDLPDCKKTRAKLLPTIKPELIHIIKFDNFIK